jgi:hypothetical protein
MQMNYIQSMDGRGDVTRTRIARRGVKLREEQLALNQSYQGVPPRLSRSSKPRPRFLLQDRVRAFLPRLIGGGGLGVVLLVQTHRWHGAYVIRRVVRTKFTRGGTLPESRTR